MIENTYQIIVRLLNRSNNKIAQELLNNTCKIKPDLQTFYIMGAICSFTDDQVGVDTNPDHFKIKLNNIFLQINNIPLRNIRSQSLVILGERQCLSNSSILLQMVQNKQQTNEYFKNPQNIIEITQPIKNVQFKKVIICCVPVYNTIRISQFNKQLSIVFDELFSKTKDMMFVFTPTCGQHTLPNQIIIAGLLKYIEQNIMNERINVKLGSDIQNILTLYKFQIMKASAQRKQLYTQQRAKISEIQPTISY